MLTKEESIGDNKIIFTCFVVDGPGRLYLVVDIDGYWCLSMIISCRRYRWSSGRLYFVVDGYVFRCGHKVNFIISDTKHNIDIKDKKVCKGHHRRQNITHR